MKYRKLWLMAALALAAGLGMGTSMAESGIHPGAACANKCYSSYNLCILGGGGYECQQQLNDCLMACQF
jgi:hypothetical protein